jgi:hypothetical protein
VKIYGVYEESAIGPRLEAIHSREWAADWQAWKTAAFNYLPEGTTYWSEHPQWGPPGWVKYDDDWEAITWVTEIPVKVP